MREPAVSASGGTDGSLGGSEPTVEPGPLPGDFSGGTPVTGLGGMGSTEQQGPSAQPDAGAWPAPSPGVPPADAGSPIVSPGPVAVPACVGWALELDGASFAVVPRRVENDFTLEAWIKTSAAVSGPRAFEGRALFDSDVVGAGSDFLSTIVEERVGFGIGGSADVGLRGQQVVTTQEWVHVALTRNAASGELQIFINGERDAVTTGTNLSPLTGQPNLAFGGAATSAHFIGSMDEIRVWNVVRSADQIAANMRERSSGSENGLVGYYTFEDRGASQTADTSPTRAMAMLVGNPSYVPSTVLCPPGKGL